MGLLLHYELDFGDDLYEASPIEELVEGTTGLDVTSIDSMEFFVAGEPVPQGSTKSFYIEKLNRVVTTHGNRNTERWRQRIAAEAQRCNEVRESTFFCEDRNCGYIVRLHFQFSKPKSMPKKRHLNTKRPDLDKLIRAVLDGITGVLIPDDAQVIGIAASKSYCDGSHQPGLTISIRKKES
jgi:Holliday junction resolvase RusA-like endonuclease